jgi:hypothetical protein
MFPIIFNYDRVSAPGKWECADSNSWPIHWGMTVKCRWTMPAQLHRLEGAYREGKAAWCSVPGLLYTLFLLLCTLFFLAVQDCGCCKYALRTADLCKLILCVTTSLGNIKEAAIAVWSAQNVPFCAIILHYFTIIAIIFSIICIIPKQKVAIWVGIHCS